MRIQAPVFNIQHYSIHDGPGIRVTVFVKGCPLRCRWCANPESNEAKPQLMTYRNRCTGCGACVKACPRGAVTLRDEGENAFAETDRLKCTGCGACVEGCYADAREIAGRMMTVEEVLKSVLADRLFLEESGGGMTVSGGELLTHPDFAEALLFAAHREGLHTAVESCAFAPRETVRRVFRHVDLALLDIKHMDPEAHLRGTGVSNEQILDNIRFVHCEMGIALAVRVPVIPGYNDSTENIAATARFVREKLGRDAAVHLLPYHRMGEGKNENLGRNPAFTAEPPSDEKMQILKGTVERCGVRCQIGG